MDYHDLQKSTKEQVESKTLTKIHGRPTWRQWKRMFEEACAIAVLFKVSYGWSGNFGLLALILGAARHAIDHPTLAAFVRPNRPPDTPNYPNNASGVVIKNITDAWNVTRRDWAVLQGFIEGFSTIIQRVVDR